MESCDAVFASALNESAVVEPQTLILQTPLSRDVKRQASAIKGANRKRPAADAKQILDFAGVGTLDEDAKEVAIVNLAGRVVSLERSQEALLVSAKRRKIGGDNVHMARSTLPSETAQLAICDQLVAENQLGLNIVHHTSSWLKDHLFGRPPCPDCQHARYEDCDVHLRSEGFAHILSIYHCRRPRPCRRKAEFRTSPVDASNAAQVNHMMGSSALLSGSNLPAVRNILNAMGITRQLCDKALYVQQDRFLERLRTLADPSCAEVRLVLFEAARAAGKTTLVESYDCQWNRGRNGDGAHGQLIDHTLTREKWQLDHRSKAAYGFCLPS